METTMHKLGIHHMTALETDPVTFVSLAAETGCQEVSVFAQSPGSGSRFPLVTRENLAAVRSRLLDTGVSVANIDAFIITPETDVAAFRPALELGAELGARGAVTILYDRDESRVVDTLGGLCEVAETLALKIAFEFMALTPAWNSLRAAAALVESIGRSNLVLDVDVLHLARSGGCPADVGEIEPGLIAHAQLCDVADLTVTADYAAEAAANRLAPGDGVFPLDAFLRALPRGTPLELEVPQPQDRPPLERMQHAVTATRELLNAIGPD
jgi:sugar phosphate isomerase/epimerase